MGGEERGQLMEGRSGSPQPKDDIDKARWTDGVASEVGSQGKSDGLKIIIDTQLTAEKLAGIRQRYWSRQQAS